jgi:hypothetical protein
VGLSPPVLKPASNAIGVKSPLQNLITYSPLGHENSVAGRSPLRITNYELRITNYELRITNYELRITNYELRITNYLSTGSNKGKQTASQFGDESEFTLMEIAIVFPQLPIGTTSFNPRTSPVNIF